MTGTYSTMTDNRPSTEAETVAALGTAISEPQDLSRGDDGSPSPYIVVPNGYQIESLEKYQFTPDRHRGTVVLQSVESFIRYVNIYKENDITLIYADQKASKIVAVLNDHGEAVPGWQDHRAEYHAPFSPEWEAWRGMDGQKMPQLKFAQFIERNMPDFHTPPSSDMLQIALSIQAKKKVNYSSDVRLPNGSVKISYEEDVSGTAVKGSMEVPSQFKLGIPVYLNGKPYEVDAFLRYELVGSTLQIWYDLIRPHKILEHAFGEILKAIGDKEIGTGLDPLLGTPVRG